MSSFTPSTSLMQNEPVNLIVPDPSEVSVLCIKDASYVAKLELEEKCTTTESSIASVDPDVDNARVTYAASAVPVVISLSNTAADDNSSPRQWYDYINNYKKAPLTIDNTKVNSKTIGPSTQTPMARVDIANKSNSYRPLDFPACRSYSGTSCRLTTAKLNHTSPTDHNAGPTSNTLAANAGSATFTTHEPSISVVVSGQPAAASVSSDASVQFANPVRNKFQFQSSFLNSSNSKGSSYKEVDANLKKCRICSGTSELLRRYGAEQVCIGCGRFFGRHSLEYVQIFKPCVRGTNCCDINFIKGKRIPCTYCRFMKCRDLGMKKLF